MSGIEVVGLAFGVLPILIEVVNSYSSVSKKIHTLRHYSKDVKSISEQLKVHKGIFLNEVRLLLRSIEDEGEVESMLEDEADQRWTSRLLNDKLKTVLRDSFEICCSVVEETKDTIEVMRKEMAEFDVLLVEKAKGESIKSTFKRLKGAIKITFDKSRHERCLASLRDRNGDLSSLRSQVDAFQRPANITTNNVLQHKPLPTKLASINNASLKLHEALCGAWCCDDSAHRGHYAKLCIDAEVQAEVRLDLAISCHEPSLNVNNHLLQAPPIWLYVQSMSTSGSDTEQQTTAAVPPLKRPSLSLELMPSSAVNAVKKKASVDLQAQSSCRKKAKRVHFVDASTVSMAAPAVMPIPIAITTPEVNLRQTKSICNYLQTHYQTFDAASTKRCIGYLESPRMYKHIFYFRDDDQKASELRQTPVSNMYSVFDIMQQDADDAIAVEDQLKLAHKTALEILQFNNTPWLSERWRLRDMSYFGAHNTFDKNALETLHLSSQISAPSITRFSLLVAWLPVVLHLAHSIRSLPRSVSNATSDSAPSSVTRDCRPPFTMT